jgi:hypothetical protein
MVNSVVFHNEDQQTDSLVVFDLSKREALTGELLKQAVLKMTADEHYKECKKCPLFDTCVVKKNRKLLKKV